jgi:nucleobase:cation symporter-1, NCS1 family
VVAGYQISWAIYVSDYSRYLPPDVPMRKTFYWTYWGSAIGGAWMMIVGATLAGWADKSFDGTGIADKNFLGNFNNVLLMILYLFVPWTAVNLVDYCVVRRGHCAIAETFDPRGIYGRWGWRGLLAYLIGFAAMIPFFDVGTRYEGAAARALGGADISFFIGPPVAGLLYCAFTRSVDVAAETRIAEAEAAEPERAATEHRSPDQRRTGSRG